MPRGICSRLAVVETHLPRPVSRNRGPLSVPGLNRARGADRTKPGEVSAVRWVVRPHAWLSAGGLGLGRKKFLRGHHPRPGWGSPASAERNTPSLSDGPKCLAWGSLPALALKKRGEAVGKYPRLAENTEPVQRWPRLGGGHSGGSRWKLDLVA